MIYLLLMRLLAANYYRYVQIPYQLSSAPLRDNSIGKWKMFYATTAATAAATTSVEEWR